MLCHSDVNGRYIETNIKHKHKDSLFFMQKFPVRILQDECLFFITGFTYFVNYT